MDKRGLVPASQLRANPFNPRTLNEISKAQGRLAFREEGDFWNCYYAKPDTMKGAIFIGSIRIRAINNKLRQDQFMKVMQDTIADIFAEKGYMRNDNVQWIEKQRKP